MGMSWDFTNYTFSFLVSLIGTILGICYPLFLENIRKIDDQYQSTVLAKRFQEAPVFKLYRLLLITAIIISFLAPFIMLFSDNSIVNIGVETIHCLFVLALVFVMLYMFRVIQTYYNPDDLSRLLFEFHKSQHLPVDRELLMASVDLMRYSCERNNMDVYRISKGYLVNAATLEQIPVGYEYYNLSSLLQNTFIRITDLSTDETLKPLCYDNILVQVYYNIFCKGFNGENNYATIWHSLNKIMESENTEWFQQYWSAAISYCGLIVKNLRSDASKYVFKNQARFLEFHHALGAMLVYQRKNEWLHYILTTDNVSPRKFDLIPGSLNQIFFHMVRFEHLSDRPWELTGKYQMNGISNDVNSDQTILLQLYRYFTLLIMRLYSYNDYNIGYCDPMQLPNIDGYDLRGLKDLKGTVERILYTVNYWYDDNRISEIYLPVTPEKSEVIKLLDGLIEKINARIQFHINNPELDTDKFEELKSLLAEADNKSKVLADMPNEEEKRIWGATSIEMTIEYQLDADISSKDGYKGWSNFPEVILQALNTKVARYIDSCYSFIEPLVDLRISEKNLFAALDKLQIPKECLILSMGVYLGGIDVKYNKKSILTYDYTNNTCSYGKIPVIENNSAYSVVFIIKKSDLLKMETLEVGVEDEKFNGMGSLEGSKYHLYTNIDEIIQSESPAPILKLGKKICIYTKQNIEIIRIRVARDGDDSMEIARLKPWKEYLKTNS